MKKTIIISALALFSALHLSYAMSSNNEILPPAMVKGNLSVSPFCLSIIKGDLEMVRKLIQLGANVNQKSNGMTPAMYAAKYNRADILELLVNYGAEVKRKSVKGLTALDYAKKSKAIDTMAFLEKSS